MPTPSAMLTAMELLSDGWDEIPGIGELVGVDLGGATTDVYSVAEGSPANTMTVIKGLQEPYTKRTVEGDIGMRYSVRAVSYTHLNIKEKISWIELSNAYLISVKEETKRKSKRSLTASVTERALNFWTTLPMKTTTEAL